MSNHITKKGILFKRLSTAAGLTGTGESKTETVGIDSASRRLTFSLSLVQLHCEINIMSTTFRVRSNRAM